MDSLGNAIQEFDVADSTSSFLLSPEQAGRLKVLCTALVALQKGQTADSLAMVAGLEAAAEIAVQAHPSIPPPASGSGWIANWIAMPAIAGSKLRIASGEGSELEFFLDSAGVFYCGVLVTSGFAPDSDPIIFQVLAGHGDGLVRLSIGQNEVSLPMRPADGSPAWTHAPAFRDPGSIIARAAAMVAQTGPATAPPPLPSRTAAASSLPRAETAVPAQRQCHSCGRRVTSASVRFCIACGVALAPPVAPQSSVSTCFTCRAPLPSDARFCPKCGQPAENVPASCPRCGTGLMAGVRFCPKCGQRFGS